MSLRVAGSMIRFSPSSVRAPRSCRSPGSAKDYFVDGKILVEANNREADAAGHLLSVGQNKWHVLFFTADTDSFEHPLRDPGEFAPGVHKKFGYDDGC